MTTGCYPVASPIGGLFVTKVGWDGGVANPDVKEEKTGQACAVGFLGMFAFGDATISTAKKNGYITRVATVDRDSTSVYLLFSRYCVIVTGE